ncbi:MAG: UpxY family transcription antiterminator [Lepagella sp.]
MSTECEDRSVMTVPVGVGSAVGVSKSDWFVAIVKNNTEKNVLRSLTALGYQCYLPIQEEVHVWKSGKRRKVDRVVIPTMIFVKCSEEIRRQIVRLPYINRFLTDRAGSSVNNGQKPIAKIPNEQIQKLMFMVGNSNEPITFSSTPYKKGDKVRVVRGKLAGLEGEVRRIDDKHSELIVDLNMLGNARLTIETINVERVN